MKSVKHFPARGNAKPSAFNPIHLHLDSPETTSTSKNYRLLHLGWGLVETSSFLKGNLYSSLLSISVQRPKHTSHLAQPQPNISLVEPPDWEIEFAYCYLGSRKGLDLVGGN